MHHFEVTVQSWLSEADIDRTYQLYQNVSNKNYALNNIEFPRSLFGTMSQSPRWEFIQIRLKSKYLAAGDHPLVGTVCNYRTDESYCAVVLGYGLRLR